MTIHRSDPLHERLLARELQQARELGRASGLPGLLQHATAQVAARAQHELRLRPGASGSDLPDFAVVTESVARAVLALELEAEACLLVARPLLQGPLAPTALEQLLTLAESTGRWSRQVQALALLRVAAQWLEAEQRQSVARNLERLTEPSAPRWVQPAALDTLVHFDAALAFERAGQRLRSDAGGEDFIVRSRIVELCAKHHKRGWQALLPPLYRDPSELVRCSVARAQHDKTELAQLAAADPSHRVRALALLKLRRRFPLSAKSELVRALVDDTHAFVVETAARELTMLCRHRTQLATLHEVAALAGASQREELPPGTRALCREMSLELELLANGASALLGSLRTAAEATPPGGSSVTRDVALSGASDQELGRALAVLARDDFGLGLTRTPDGVRVFRGERRSFSWWRLLYELLHPGSSKRQAFRHTVARRGAGDLRAHPQAMAEVTATRVPGERVFVPEQGEWGRHLPLVEDLLSLGLLAPAELRLASARGLTLVRGPAKFAGRAQARLSLLWNYARLARLRERALASPEQHVQAAYVEEVTQRTGIQISLLPTPSLSESLNELPRERPRARPAGSAVLALGPLLGTDAERGPAALLSGWWEELSTYAASPGGNRLSHLATFAVIMLGAMTLRAIRVKRGVERDRRAIPLVIGGWGTRGKSGTERLKAALFQGVGYECLVKTTGCEAMFIHAIPGVAAREVFIYRPYDKATVWEQRDVLSLAAKLGVKVFLWECMALQPDLVDLLQAQWMRDDYSTITNTYPDHEDVQGPTGFDVATTISEFVPHAGRLFTSEEQMLPLLREQARKRSTRITAVTAREAELIPEDLLKRFGHAEHPRNVALVLRLARSLGIPATVALTEMADNVVPDLGVLKTYGPVSWQGRKLSFCNGMGANDRAGTLGNWARAGFAEAAAQPERWLVTVVNNRADRVARSEVFAKLLVEDISAHRHVLVGTNVVGLVGLIERALTEHLRALALSSDLPSDDAARQSVVRERVRRALSRCMLHDLSAVGALTEAALDARSELVSLIEPLLDATSDAEPLDLARSVVEEALRAVVDPEYLRFLAQAVARRRIARGLLRAVEARFHSEPERVNELFCAGYRALFLETLIVVPDPKISGDALIARIGSEVPPGAHASLMGMQNIKGTGLDFVYRWLSIDAVLRLLSRLPGAGAPARQEVLSQLLSHGDYGLVDASLALTCVSSLEPAETDPERALRQSLTAKLEALVERRKLALAPTQGGSLRRHAAKFFRASFDFVDSVLRRRRADQIVTQLVAGRISHAAAAAEMRGLVARGKARDG